VGTSFIDLTNNALKQFNEVKLVTATFDTATGFHEAAKDFVNQSIQEIHQAEPAWPFNHTSTNHTLTASNYLYDFPADAEKLDFDTFRLLRSDALEVSARYLPYVDYDMFVARYLPDILNATNITSTINPPAFVFKTQNNGWGVGPGIPDRAYTVGFEYWLANNNLVYSTNTTVIPSRFDKVINDGAKAHAYNFRGDRNRSEFYKVEFYKGIARMRSILIDRAKEMQDGRVGLAG
jgi:hypothetical protein